MLLRLSLSFEANMHQTHSVPNKRESMRQTNDKAKIKQQRVMKYFIDAANQIIQEEGIEAVTIRRAADIAGYASATLYNYFENLPHLVFLATMTYLEEYHEAIPHYVNKCEDSIERYMAICKCFTVYSLANPEIYELLFFTHGNDKLEEYTRQYYELFPERIVKDAPAPFNKIYDINNLYSRSFIMLNDCVEDGFITKDMAEDFNDVALMVSKYILEDVKTGALDKRAGTAKTMKYYRQIFRCYVLPEHRHLVEKAADKWS